MKVCPMKKSIFLLFGTIIVMALFACQPMAATMVAEPAVPVVSETPSATLTPVVTATVRYHFPAILTPESREALSGEGVATFRILHLNDFHAEIIENSVDGAWMPGAGRLATVIQEERAVLGADQSLLLDAGDWSEGTYPSFPVHPLDVLEVYKMLGVDAVTIGNHEFFVSRDVFYQVLQASPPMEILSANFRVRDAENHCMEDLRLANPYKIYELGAAEGEMARVAVVGLAMRDLQFQAPGRLEGICFPEPKDEVKALYDEIMATEKPDVIVLLTHIGLSGDKMLAEYLNRQGRPVDIIIGGHSHSWIEKPVLVGTTVVVTAGERGRALGILDLRYDRASDTLETEWQLRGITACVAEDAEMMAYLKGKFAAVYAGEQFKFQNSDSVQLVFDGKSDPNGLWIKEEPGDDGSTMMIEKEGMPAVANTEGSRYIYFDVANTFYGCPQPIELTVEYFDEGFGPMYVEIDKAPVGPEHPCNLCYTQKYITTLTNTKTWKTATITLTDATFNGNQKWGTDFRISAYELPIYMHSVVIKKAVLNSP